MNLQAVRNRCVLKADWTRQQSCCTPLQEIYVLRFSHQEPGSVHSTATGANLTNIGNFAFIMSCSDLDRASLRVKLTL